VSWGILLSIGVGLHVHSNKLHSPDILSKFHKESTCLIARWWLFCLWFWYPFSCPSLKSHLCTFHGQLWSDVEVEVDLAVLYFVPLTRIEIDDIVYLLPTSVYSPIMPVERWFVSPISIAFRREYPSHVLIRARGDNFVESPLKLTNFGPPHLLLDKNNAIYVHCTSSSFFPFENLRPCSLVNGIVDRHYSFHVDFLWIPVFPSHGIEKHLFGWVHPEFGIIWSIGCGYWTHYTIGLERSCLSW